MTLLDRVSEFLDQHRIPYALIGAGALAAHGIARSTLDFDLLTTDSMLLRQDLWSPLSADATIDIRTGDAADPLLGVVRIRERDQRDVDIVVGRDDWQREILERAQQITIGDRPLKVATRADLVLLKLFAGGSQDQWDIEQLLALDRDGAIRREADARIHALPPRSRALWRGFQIPE